MNVQMLCNIFIFAPFAAGLFAYIIGANQKTRQALDGFVILVTLAQLCLCSWLIYQLSMAGGNFYTLTAKSIECGIPEICGFGLHFKMDGFRAVYAMISTFMWAMTALMSKEYFQHHKNVERFYLFFLWTLGATLGVFLSADLMTTFIFFEIMSFTSYVWVAQEENRPSLRAAETYLGVAVIGGLVMLMGIFLLYRYAGTLDIDQLMLLNCRRPVIIAAGICMLVGFGVKAGAFPLHIWLPKAHPVAPAPASALLSGVLTKTGIYGILILSCRLFYQNADWGKGILVIGAITMFGGALLALFSIDLKRTLACSSMSQIGFILVGIGMINVLGRDSELAMHGTVLHMINHSLIKLVLFMAAGVIYQKVHSLDLNVLRGYGRNKHRLKLFFLAGALSIGGIPGFSGYISKTLLHESILEADGPAYQLLEWLFLLSGGMTVAYMTKLFVAVFVEKNQNARLQKEYEENNSYMSVTSYAALLISALALFILGLFPYTYMERFAIYAEDFMQGFFTIRHQVVYYAFENLKGAGISVLIGIVLYLLVVRGLLMKNGAYVNRLPKWLDLEELLYRPLLLGLLPLIAGIVCRVFDSILDGIVVLLRKTLYRDSEIPYERMEGSMFSDFLGGLCNDWQAFANRTYRKKNPVHKDYVHILAMKRLGIRETNLIIQRSLSFGLLLFCIGLGLALIYVILL